MKVTLLLLFFSVAMAFGEDSYSQNAEISLKLNNVTVEKVLDEIESQSEFYFMFNQKLVNVNRKVSIKVKNKRISDILTDLFHHENVKFSVIDRQILIYPKDISAVEKNKFNILQQEIQISGKVIDEDGFSIPGVSIYVNGTTIGTISDANGNYTIEIPANVTTLHFSFIGMKDLDVDIAGKKIVNVTMIYDSISLNEVVSIGYGTVKKKDLTGSVAVVTAKDFNIGGSVSNPEQLIQGRVAGVNVSAASAQPGAVPIMRIRGSNSLGSSNQPLFVVDGLPMESLDNMISVEDIKTMEVLKDASATAIYGTRGANGVVVITTKRGREGKSNVDFSYEHSFDFVANEDTYDFLNAQEYVKVTNDDALRNGQPVPFTNEMIGVINKYGNGTDWMKELFQPGRVNKYNVGITSGTKDTRVYFSTNYMDWEGVIPNTSFDKFTGRLNLDQNMFNDKLKISLSSQISSTSQNILGFRGSNMQSNVLRNIFKSSNPITPTDLNNWSEEDRDIVFGTGIRPMNPIEIVYKDDLHLTKFAVISNFTVEYNILEGFYYKFQAGVNVRNGKQRHFLPTVNGLVATDIPMGSAEIGQSNYTETNIENIFRYSKVFADKHSLEALAVYSNRILNGEGFAAAAGDFPSENLRWNNLGAGALILSPSSFVYETKLISYTGRVNYGFANRYNLSATFRRDGSSKFGANHKWGNFPSFAAAWKINNESFFNVNSISTLKLRVGWGVTGNDRFPFGAGQAKFNPGASVTLDGDNVRKGVVGQNLGNDNLQWEETRSTNIGLDLGFFNERISVNLDLYQKMTDKLLWDKAIPSSLGYSTVFSNVGSMENKGIEVLLSTVNVSGHSFNWSSDFTFAYNHNEIKKLDLPEGTRFIEGPEVGHHIQVSALIEGESVSSFFGYKYRGILQEGESDPIQTSANPGDALFEDTNGDGMLGSDDRVVLGRGIPKYTIGFNNNVNYKNWELSFFFQAATGFNVMNMNRIEGYNRNALATALYERWTPENTTGTMPLEGWTNTYYTNDYNLEKGDFLSLKMLRVSYSLPTKKAGVPWLNNLKVYFSASNLFVFTNYSGFHPEVNSSNEATNSGRPSAKIDLMSGVDSYAYPHQKSYVFGIKFGF